MVVTSKSINVDFAPGETIETAIKDAFSMAVFTRTTVKFKFNDIPMTINPPDWSLIGFKTNVAPKKGWEKDVRKKIDGYLDEFHAKCGKRDARVERKLFEKKLFGKKNTSRKGKDCETCEEECTLRGDR